MKNNYLEPKLKDEKRSSAALFCGWIDNAFPQNKAACSAN